VAPTHGSERSCEGQGRRRPAEAVCAAPMAGTITRGSYGAREALVNGILRWGVPLAFLMHGLGMIGGIYFVFTGQGWLAKSLGGGALIAARVVTAAVWLISGVAFVAAAWGLWKDLDWCAHRSVACDTRHARGRRSRSRRSAARHLRGCRDGGRGDSGTGARLVGARYALARSASS
jgi:hypothetical protein